jgi:hypothetical protein
MGEAVLASSAMEPPPKKSRTNTPWTPAEELRLKNMRDAGNSWAEIAKVRLPRPQAGLADGQDWDYEIVIPNPNRRQREEALVQGMLSHAHGYQRDSLTIGRICTTLNLLRTRYGSPWLVIAPPTRD